MNLRTDLSWVKRITSAHPGSTEEFVDHLVTYGNIRFDSALLITRFDMKQFFDKGFFPISFFYLGMLTLQDDFYLKLPNLNMRQIFIEYFNELHHIDVSTRFAEIMESFVMQPDIESLFAGYWREYVSVAGSHICAGKRKLLPHHVLRAVQPVSVFLAGVYGRKLLPPGQKRS